MGSVFIVFGESGKWDDYEKRVVATFTEKELAITWAKKAQEKVDAIYDKIKVYKDIPDEGDDKPFDWFDLFGPPDNVLEFYSEMSELLNEDDNALRAQLDTEWFAIRLEARKQANPYDLDMVVDRYTTTKYFVAEFNLDPSV